MNFDKFWSAYPRKQAKPTAQAAWDKHNCESEAEQIIAHVEVRAKRDAQWLAGKKFIPMPSTFLNQKRWLDEYEQVDPNKSKHTKKTVVQSTYEPPESKQPCAWKGMFNNFLVKLMMRTGSKIGHRDFTLIVLRQRDLYAAQMREIYGLTLPEDKNEEFDEMKPAMKRRFEELVTGLDGRNVNCLQNLHRFARELDVVLDVHDGTPDF